MRRLFLVALLLAICVSLRPVEAGQSATQTPAPAINRALIDQFIAADTAERKALVAANAELLSKPYRAEFSKIGHAFKAALELGKAETCYRAALFVAKEYGFADTEAAALTNLGILEGIRGNIAVAKQLFEEALAIATAHNDAASVQSSYANLAIIQRRVGDLEGAMATQTHALDLAHKLEDKVAIAKTLNNIGVIYLNLGNLERALQYYLDSLAIKEATDYDPAETVLTLSNIVAVYDEQNDIPLALEYGQRALNVLKAHNAPASASISTLNNIGHLYLTIGDFARARESLNQSLALAEKVGDPSKISTTLYNLATIARIEKKPAEAEALWRRSLALREQTGEPLGLAETLTDLAHHLERQGRTAEALPYAERAVTLAEQSRLINQLWKAQMATGDIHAQLGHDADARRAYEASVASVELLRRQVAGGPRGVLKFLSDRMGPYYGLAGIEAKMGRTFEALVAIDKARARTLVDIMVSGPRPSHLLTPAQKEREALVTQTVIDASSLFDLEAKKTKPNAQRLMDLDRTVSQARISRDAFLGELYNARPDVSFVRGNTPEITLERLADTLAPGTALVTFAVSDNTATSYFVTLGAHGPEIVATPLKITTPDLLKLAQKFSGQIASRDLGFSSTSHQLYDTLFGSADAALVKINHLIVIPDGRLWDVPFQALQTPRNRFLVEERAVSYAPSLTALAALETRSRSRASREPFLVALGDPAITGSVTPSSTGSGSAARPNAARRRDIGTRLPEAAREVRTLGQIYGAAKSTVLTDAEASETAFRLRVAKATVVHIATHGVLDDSNPMYSHLQLASGTGTDPADPKNHLSDGRLEAWELADLDLSANLAVLSACDTARGNGSFGEGIVGLSWSLFAAGASTAVVSQWEVDSASTTSLMIAFHERLLKPGDQDIRARSAATGRAVVVEKSGVPASVLLGRLCLNWREVVRSALDEHRD